MSQTRAGKILLVDDDVELIVLLSDYLRGEGFAVDAVYNGEDAVAAATAHPGVYDAIILDVMLPRVSGIEVLRRIRQRTDIPILMLTAKGDSIDRVVGLELGADDYVTKPYFPRELGARLRAVLRRGGRRQAVTVRTEFLIGNLHVELGTRRVRCADRALELTSSEFKLLVTLLQAEDRVVSKDELSQLVLGRPRGPFDRSIDVHVSNLRQKLTTCGATVVLETVRGIGYRIEARR